MTNEKNVCQVRFEEMVIAVGGQFEQFFRCTYKTIA